MVRTITEAYQIMSEYLSGDREDAEVYKVNEKGERISKPYASGMLTAWLVQGAITRTLVFDGTEIAMLGNNIKWTDSVHVDDSLYPVIIPTSKRLSKSMPGAGIIEYKIIGYNQNDDAVIEMNWTVMVAVTYEDAVKYSLDEEM